VNLPVGKILSDHFAVELRFSFNDNGSLVSHLTEDSLKKYHKHGQGVITDALLSGQAFLASSRAKGLGQMNWPDLQIEMGLEEGPVLSMVVILTRRQTTGYLSLNTTAYKAGLFTTVIHTGIPVSVQYILMRINHYDFITIPKCILCRTQSGTNYLVTSYTTFLTKFTEVVTYYFPH
jgi:hypothetical protein